MSKLLWCILACRLSDKSKERFSSHADLLSGLSFADTESLFQSSRINERKDCNDQKGKSTKNHGH